MITISYITLLLVIIVAASVGFTICSLISSVGTYDRIHDAYNEGIEVGRTLQQESEAK